jgi:ATP-dependent DNA helicase RecQ
MTLSVPISEYDQFLARFQLESFRAGQQEVIAAVMDGSDCLCIMPTGGGKSLCYQLPSVARDGLTLVVSPLIALMKDQVDGLSERGIAATFINSSLGHSEQQDRLQRMVAGEYDLVYVAPERMRSSAFRETIGRSNVQLLAIDEAHCISEWGHDFRPDYAKLGDLRARIGNPQTIALTATATPLVQEDIVKQLELPDPQIFVSGFARDNLRFEVRAAAGQKEKSALLIRAISEVDGGVLVYAATRKGCDEIAQLLRDNTKLRIGVYHAGLTNDSRRTVQEKFMADGFDVIIATNAFGMGVDKPDLRLVVHYNMPGSLEAYYQEAGRGGRDGLPSRCLLLFSYADRFVQEFFIDNSYPPKATVASVYNYLCRFENDPIEITQDEIREALDKSVGSNGVSASEKILEKAGAIKRLDSQSNRASLWLESDAPTLVDLVPRDAKNQLKVLLAAEKLVGDRRYERVSFSFDSFMNSLDISRESVVKALRELCRLTCFDYAPPFRGRAIHMNDRKKSFASWEIDFTELDRRKNSEQQKLERVIQFAHTRNCRQLYFLQYFGDRAGKPCGICDVCTPSATKDFRSKPVNIETDEGFVRSVRIALSGVARGKERFGKQLIAQMLSGSKSSKMAKFGLDQLSTFGLLAHLKQSTVVELMEMLLVEGWLQQREQERHRPVLTLSPAGAEIMRGATILNLQEAWPDSLALAIRNGGSAARDGAPGAAPDSDIASRIRNWRSELATKLGVPEYRVLHNATLEDLAVKQPTNLGELAGVHGIGPSTIEKFGKELLQLVEGKAVSPVQHTELPGKAETAGADVEYVVQPEFLSEDFDFEPSPAVTAKTTAEVPPGNSQVSPADAGAPDEAPVASAIDATVVETPMAGAASQVDAAWTIRLLDVGFSPDECAQIRRTSIARIFQDLVQCLSIDTSIQIHQVFATSTLLAWRPLDVAQLPDEIASSLPSGLSATETESLVSWAVAQLEAVAK